MGGISRGGRLLSQRQPEEETGSLRGVGDCEAAAVVEGGLPGEGEAESEAGASGGDEGVEKALADFRRNSGTGIFDADENLRSFGFGGDADAAAIGHGVERVANEIEEDALHAGTLEVEFDGVGAGDGDLDILLLGSGGLGVHRRADNIAETA